MQKPEAVGPQNSKLGLDRLIRSCDSLVKQIVFLRDHLPMTAFLSFDPIHLVTYFF